jgi:putative glutamine amidotransferase
MERVVETLTLTESVSLSKKLALAACSRGPRTPRANYLVLRSDIAPEFLQQPVPDPSLLDKDVDPKRDRWELDATKRALALRLPIFAICKGMQLFNVALGGTLRLDIPGHDVPEMRDHNLQPLRTERTAAHRLEKVNSSHHQAIDRLGDDLEVEAWCATDDIIEQVRLRDYPFALAVQYHPERGEGYAALFADFVSRLGASNHSSNH